MFNLTVGQNRYVKKAFSDILNLSNTSEKAIKYREKLSQELIENMQQFIGNKLEKEKLVDTLYAGLRLNVFVLGRIKPNVLSLIMDNTYASIYKKVLREKNISLDYADELQQIKDLEQICNEL